MPKPPPKCCRNGMTAIWPEHKNTQPDHTRDHRKRIGDMVAGSTDNGKTWVRASNLRHPHAPIELTDDVFGCWQSKSLDILNTCGAIRPKTLRCRIIRRWSHMQRLGDIPQRPGDPLGTYHEPYSKPADGRIVVAIRNHSEQDKWRLCKVNQPMAAGPSASRAAPAC